MTIATARLAPSWVPNGILPLNGQPLVLVVVDTPYSPSVTTAADLTGAEVGRCTATGRVTETADRWTLYLDAVTSTDLTGPRQQVVVCTDGADDSHRQVVGWGPDPGPQQTGYTPSAPSGFVAIFKDALPVTVESVTGDGVDNTDPRNPVLSYAPYTPGDGSMWADPAPDTVADALDRIAAVIGTTTPIP